MAYTTINKSTDYFNTLLWTGDGSGSRNITGVGFQPDWVWGKCRNTTVSHALYDAVRGGSKLLNSNSSSAESTNAALNAFISDGFTVNSDSYLNGNSNTYVAWNWKANGAGSPNYDGSITSTVSAGITQGMSIVSYTGTGSNATVGHGLGPLVAPKAIIIKQRSIADGWVVFFPTLDITLSLNSTNTNNHSSKFSSFFNSTDPTNTLISLGTDDQTNKSGATYIAYCFAENASKLFKIGSYVGNGSNNGTFIYTGGKPVWVLIKRTDAGNSWSIKDNKRDPINPADERLRADTNNAGDTNEDVDFLSNGFKCRASGDNQNASGATYIYMAINQPIVGQNNVPCTAR